jgi:hypothetical protein
MNMKNNMKNNINIYIKNIDDIYNIKINKKYTIQMIKNDLYKLKNLIITKHKLYFNDIELNDNRYIEYYNIKNEDIIFSTILD